MTASSTTRRHSNSRRRRRPVALFLLASASAAAMSIVFSLLLSLESSLLSKQPHASIEVVDLTIPTVHKNYPSQIQTVNTQVLSFSDGASVAGNTRYETHYDHQQHNRQLQLSMTEEVTKTKTVAQQHHNDETVNNNNNNDNKQIATKQQQHSDALVGQSTSGPGVIVNMLRRARDKVDEKDVPFLLQVPYTNSDVMYNIMTECYGLVGNEYWDVKDIQKGKEANVVDSFYVSSHDRPKEMFHDFGQRFHFLSTPHYQEGASLLTLKHKGRIILMMRHPAYIAESMYLTRPNTQKGDLRGLLRFVNSTDYYDNWMTRMLANVPKNTPVTEEHFKYARMILENKFVIGMTNDMAETITKRIKLHFGWKELPSKNGCELDYIKRGTMELPTSALEEGSREWRFIAKRNLFDAKLHARGMAVFGMQKMRIPVHPYTVRDDRKVVSEAFAQLRNVQDERDSSDIPFYWHIPKASGTTVKEVMSKCYNLIRTEMVQPPSSLDLFKEKKVLNVDLTTPEAILIAKGYMVADAGLADVFISQLAIEGSTVFTTYHMGRAFTIMRHPVILAASLFYYRRIATWEPTYRPDFNDVTLQEYIELPGYYDNWMVRMLTNAKLGGLNEGHLDIAKAVLKEKFIVGISDHMDETFRQFEAYFGWREQEVGCVKSFLSKPFNKNKYSLPERGGEVWTSIAEKNKFDMQLYYFALELFGEQSKKLIKSQVVV